MGLSNNPASLRLHLASWNLKIFQLNWKSKMEPSVAKSKLDAMGFKSSLVLLLQNEFWNEQSILDSKNIQKKLMMSWFKLKLS